MSDFRIPEQVLPAALRPPIQCPPRTCPADWQSDEEVLDEILRWFRKCLRCAAGRREFNRGRYMVEIATEGTLSSIYEAFVTSLRSYRHTACLFVFNAPEFSSDKVDARSTFRFLAEQMARLGRSNPEELANGGALSKTITLECPVTGVETEFDDFECIAFCPQSDDIDDPLYDPLMAAPHPCVNLSSDVFAFSYFVRESSLTKFGRPPYEVADLSTLAPFLYECVERWHRIAKATIENFAAVTDTSRCPVHLTAGGDHWVAAHRDPAFAETSKIPHRHELPIIYASRICDAWIEHFSGTNAYSASGLARAGILQ